MNLDKLIKDCKVLKREVNNENIYLELEVEEFLSGKDFPELEFSGFEKEGKKIQVIKSKKHFLSHQDIGKDLELFYFSEFSPGMPFFLPKGKIVYDEMKKIAEKIYKEDSYEEIVSPQILDLSLWKKSGHLDYYEENMYIMKEDSLAIKPMNCPGHIIYYKSKKREAQDFPLRIGELGRVHRKELSGSIQGLFRVRSFIQDDAHIFLEEGQIENEIIKILNQARRLYKSLGFSEIFINFSSRPKKFVGDVKIWNKAEKELLKALRGFEYKEKEGDGAFYGPKIDLHLKDSLGREHQVGSIQLDFNLPQKFNLKYWDNGQKRVPIMIHRALFGSLERFLGLLLEHHKGWLPFNLAPVQVAILPISEDYLIPAQELAKKIGFRCEIFSQESISKRVKNCYKKKISKKIIIGKREIEEGIAYLEDLKNGEKEKVKL